MESGRKGGRTGGARCVLENMRNWEGSYKMKVKERGESKEGVKVKKKEENCGYGNG